MVNVRLFVWDAMYSPRWDCIIGARLRESKTQPFGLAPDLGAFADREFTYDLSTIQYNMTANWTGGCLTSDRATFPPGSACTKDEPCIGVLQARVLGMHWKTFRVSDTYEEFFKVARDGPMLSSQWLGGRDEAGTYRWANDADRKLFTHVARWAAVPDSTFSLTDQTVPFWGLGVDGALARSAPKTAARVDAGSDDDARDASAPSPSSTDDAGTAH